MKTKNQSVLHTLVVVLGLIPAGRVTAQTFTTLHNFTPLIPSFTNSDGTVRHTNSDGSHPHADLILSGNTLYGVAQVGGSSSSGTIFSLSLPLPQLTIIPSG